jgi:hypothetical protein
MRSVPVPKPGLSTSDKILANAFALGVEMGCSERDLARSALTLAFTVAEKAGDPDGFLAKLVELAQKRK